MYLPGVGKVIWTASCPGCPVGSGWMWAKVPRSARVAMRCIQASWLRVRSSTGAPVSSVDDGGDQPGRLPGVHVGGQVEADIEAGVGGVGGRHVGGHHHAHRRAHRHAGALRPGQLAVHAVFGEVHPGHRGQPGAQGQGDDGDAGQVGVLADPGAQRRVQDLRSLSRAWKRRSRSALVTTLTELIAIAALASTGSSSSPCHRYRAPRRPG